MPSAGSQDRLNRSLSAVRLQMWQQSGNTHLDTDEAGIYSAKVTPLNRFIPMSVTPFGEHLYVRRCYPAYNEFIHTAMLCGFSLVTVTGSPGIGKSYFYSYFFDRFREEKPEVTIVTAAFTCERKLISCREYPPGEAEGLPRESVPKYKNILYLFDGAPDVQVDNAFMICFTCPDASWSRCMRKHPTQVNLYMPVWTFEELLALRLDEETIRTRFQLLGGLVRFCLSTLREDFYLDSVCWQILHVRYLEQVTRSLADTSGMNDLAQYLFPTRPVMRGSHRPASFLFPQKRYGKFSLSVFREAVERTFMRLPEYFLSHLFANGKQTLWPGTISSPAALIVNERFPQFQ